MRIEPEAGSASIVLLGSFNPAIFNPTWLANHGVCSERDAEYAKVEVIHRELTTFTVGDLIYKVELNRFQVESANAPWINLLDSVQKIFGDFLQHTPMSSLGINRGVHFSAGGVDVRHRVGRRLAPVEPWGEWGKELEKVEGEERAGMLSLIMQRPWSKDKHKGRVNAKVEPSSKIPAHAGIHVHVNDHVEIVDYKQSDGAIPMMFYLQENFETSITQSEQIVEQIMMLAEQEK